MDTLILNNGTVIEVIASTGLGAIQVAASDRAAMAATWAQFTPDNLVSVQIRNSEGLTTGTHTDLVLVSETSTVSQDGTVLTSYHLREKTDVEKLTERLEAIENGQEVQDGAITELADLVAIKLGEG